MAEKWHSGINMHKLPVASGFIGLVFTLGCALIFLLGLPQLWYFVAFSAVLGIGIAIVIRMANSLRGSRSNPLTILSEPAQSEVARRDDRDSPRRGAELFGGFLPAV